MTSTTAKTGNGSPRKAVVRRLILSHQSTSTSNVVVHDAAKTGATAAENEKEVENLLEAFVQALHASRGLTPARDPNWGKCTPECVDDGHVVAQGKDTFVCQVHWRQHVCNSVRGDDHPIVLIDEKGLATCMFSKFEVRDFVVKSAYDWAYEDDDDTKKETSAMIYDTTASSCNRVILEADNDATGIPCDAGAEPLVCEAARRTPHARSSARRASAAETAAAVARGSEPLTRDVEWHNRCAQEDADAVARKRRSDSRRQSAMPVPGKRDESYDVPRRPTRKRRKVFAGPDECVVAQEVPRQVCDPAVAVRTKVCAVLRALCDPVRRMAIVRDHAAQAKHDIVRRITTYVKHLHRQKMRCIYQVKEQMLVQVLNKHQRYVPHTSPQQIEHWATTVQLMWRHFGQHKRQARSGNDAQRAADSNAGMLPFIFGSLYALAAGFAYQERVLVPRDPALAEVVPPANDLTSLGFKHYYKSTGRKVLMRAVNTSLDNGSVDAFVAAVAALGAQAQDAPPLPAIASRCRKPDARVL